MNREKEQVGIWRAGTQSDDPNGCPVWRKTSSGCNWPKAPVHELRLNDRSRGLAAIEARRTGMHGRAAGHGHASVGRTRPNSAGGCSTKRTFDKPSYAAIMRIVANAASNPVPPDQ